MQISSLTLLCTLATICHQSRSVEIDNGVVGSPEVECGSNSLEMMFRAEKQFFGKIFVKGHYNEPDCRVDYSENVNSDMPVGSIKLFHGTCGMRRQRSLQPKGMEFDAVIVISFHPLFITKVDRAFHVKCFYREQQKTVTANMEVSMLTTSSLSHTAPMPICTYTIRKDEIDGDILRYARVGDQVVHRWECQSEHYGMLVHSCFVEDGRSDKIMVIDERGCHQDQYLLGDPTYVRELNMAYRESHVFKFADRVSMRSVIVKPLHCIPHASRCFKNHAKFAAKIREVHFMNFGLREASGRHFTKNFVKCVKVSGSAFTERTSTHVTYPFLAVDEIVLQTQPPVCANGKEAARELQARLAPNTDLGAAGEYYGEKQQDAASILEEGGDTTNGTDKKAPSRSRRLAARERRASVEKRRGNKNVDLDQIDGDFSSQYIYVLDTSEAPELANPQDQESALDAFLQSHLQQTNGAIVQSKNRGASATNTVCLSTVALGTLIASVILVALAASGIILVLGVAGNREKLAPGASPRLCKMPCKMSNVKQSVKSHVKCPANWQPSLTFDTLQGILQGLGLPPGDYCGLTKVKTRDTVGDAARIVGSLALSDQVPKRWS